MTLRRLIDLLLVVLVFIVMGPLIGLFIAAAMSSLGLTVAGWRGFARDLMPFLMLYGWVMGLAIGVAPAGLAGTIVAGYAGWRGRVPLAVGMLAGLVSAAIFGAMLRRSVASPEQANDGATVMAMIWLAANIGAAIACTWLTRRWQSKS
jgi:hypothetical protein